MFANICFWLTTTCFNSFVWSMQPTIDPIFANEIGNMVRLVAVALGMRENGERIYNGENEAIEGWDRNPLRISRIDEFLSRCVSESVFRQPISSAVGIETSDRRFLFGNIAIAAIGDSPIPHDTLLSVPPDIDEYYTSLLVREGMTHNFHGCTLNAIDSLPALNILFEAGMIVLSGADLFEHDSITNTCFPRYAVSNYMFHIVPELFPGVNVLFDYSEVYLCDAL